MKSIFAKIMYKLGIRTDEQKYADGEQHVSDTIRNAHLSTKDELKPIADKLWRECNPSWEGDHPFDNGMAARLLEMGFRDPGDPTPEEDFVEQELIPEIVEKEVKGERVHTNSFWNDVPHDMGPMPGCRGTSRNLMGEMFMQLEDDNMHANQQMLEDIVRTGNFRAASIADTKLQGMSKLQRKYTEMFSTTPFPKVSHYLPMPRVTPPRSHFSNKHKTLEDFFKSNTVK